MVRLFLFLLVVLLGGCALSPSTPAPATRPARAESVPFALNGRIAINHEDKRHSAGLYWIHRAQSDEVLLLTPIGQTAARVYRDAEHATLDNGNKHYSADDAEALMEQSLGWHLPLGGLHYWALGLAAAESSVHIERDGNGQITVLHQDGWEVRYLRYSGTRPDSLPTHLQLSRNDLRIQLLIDAWEWNPP